MNTNIEKLGKGDGSTELLIAFGTNDGESLTNGHAGDARLFYIQVFRQRATVCRTKKEYRIRSGSIPKPGSPETARARAVGFKSLDALAGKGFGPGLANLLKRLVWVPARANTISKETEVVRNDLEGTRQEKDKGEYRKHIVVRAQQRRRLFGAATIRTKETSKW